MTREQVDAAVAEILTTSASNPRISATELREGLAAVLDYIDARVTDPIAQIPAMMQQLVASSETVAQALQNAQAPLTDAEAAPFNVLPTNAADQQTLLEDIHEQLETVNLNLNEVENAIAAGGVGGGGSTGLKVILQGAWRGTAMGQELRLQGLLGENDSPFNLRYAANGNVADPLVGLNDLPGIVDWIYVAFHNDNTGAGAVWHEALLTINGYVKEVDGSTPFQVPLEYDGEQMFFSIFHRNHLPVTTPTAHLLVGGAALNYDFTTGLDKYLSVPSYAENNAPAVQVSGGKWALWAGNAAGAQTTFSCKINNYGASNNNDKAAIQAAMASSPNTTPGYYRQDVTMDGLVTQDDVDIVMANLALTANWDPLNPGAIADIFQHYY